MSRAVRTLVPVLALSLWACNDPYWGQAHFDIANAGTLLVGTKPALAASMRSAPVAPIAFASPVVAPDGTVYASTWAKAATNILGEGAIVQLAAAGDPVVLRQSVKSSGQLSSPAVDRAGNVYVVDFTSWNGGSGSSTLMKFDKNLNLLKSARIVGVAMSAPKIFEPSTWSFSVPEILQTYLDYSGGTHILLFGKDLDQFADVTVCTPEQPSILNFGFHVQGVDLGAPYPENASVGIRTIRGDRGDAYYLVAAGNRCGVTIYRFNPGNSAQLFTPIGHDGSGAAYISSPAISASGIAVVTDSDKHITAYNCVTGTRIWQSDSTGFLSTSAIFDPSLITFAYVASYTHLLKVDLATGKVVALKVTNLAPDPVHSTISIDGSPAGSGGHIFISTSAGVLTFDYNMALLGFTALPGGQSAPAIGTNGNVVVAGTNGTVFRFSS